MAEIEHQLRHHNLGDIYQTADNSCVTQTVKSADGKNFDYSPDRYPNAFGEKDNGRLTIKEKDEEKPLGEWKSVYLYCYGQTSVHLVNGQVVMVNTNCSKTENGKKISLTKGKIQIQSEEGKFFI